MALTYTYQWQRDHGDDGNYTNIASATANTYTLVDADDTCHVRCVVHASNTVDDITANSNAIGLVVQPVPVATVDPVLTGTARVIRALDVTTGTWSNMGGVTATYDYQWQDSDDGVSGWADIAGETTSRYTIEAAEVGKHIRAVVTATNSAGSDSSSSNVTAEIPAPDPAGVAYIAPGFYLYPITYASTTTYPGIYADASAGGTSSSSSHPVGLGHHHDHPPHGPKQPPFVFADIQTPPQGGQSSPFNPAPMPTPFRR